jgi:hypothetical protein
MIQAWGAELGNSALAHQAVVTAGPAQLQENVHATVLIAKIPAELGGLRVRSLRRRSPGP